MPITVTSDALKGLKPVWIEEPGAALYGVLIDMMELYVSSDDPAHKLSFLPDIIRLSRGWLEVTRKERSLEAGQRRDLVNRLADESEAEAVVVANQLAQQTYVADVKGTGSYRLEALTANVKPKLGAAPGIGLASIDELAQTYGVTEAEASAIRIYTADDFRYINPSTANAVDWLDLQRTTLKIDKATIPDAKLMEEGSLHASIALSGLRKLALRGNLVQTVYRGSCGTEASVKATIDRQYKLDVTSLTPSLTSSSTSKRKAAEFGSPQSLEHPPAKLWSLFVEIDNADAIDVMPFSVFRAECEALILPGRKFKTLSVVTVDPKDYDSIDPGYAHIPTLERLIKVTVTGVK